MKMKEHAIQSKSGLGASLVVVSSLFYGLYGVWTKLMGNAFGSYQQALFRCIIVVICLGAIAVRRKELVRMHWRRDAWWLVASVCGSALLSGPLYYATLHIGVGLATALMYSGFVLGMFLFGWLLSRERYTKEKFAATALAFIGLALIFSPAANRVEVAGLAAALMSGFATALTIVSCQKLPYGPSQSTLIAWSAGVLANLIMALVFGQITQPVTFDVHWFYLVLFAFTGLAASWCVVRGVKLIDAGSAGVLGLLEIVFGMVYGVIFFAERPTGQVLGGIFAIVVAATIPYIHHFKIKDEPFEL